MSADIESRVILIDSGEQYVDRYTAIIDNDFSSAFGMSTNPHHPLGFGMHVAVSVAWVQQSVERGHRIKVSDAPPKVQKCIRTEIEDYYS